MNALLQALTVLLVLYAGLVTAAKKPKVTSVIIGADGSFPAAKTNTWMITSYTPLQVEAGVKVKFIWSHGYAHGVYQSASESDYEACASTGGKQLVALKKSGTYTVNTAGWAVGTQRYYICQAPGHCEAGQQVSIEVIASTPCSTATTQQACSMKPACTYKAGVCGAHTTG